MASRYRPRRGFNFLLYQDIDMEVVLTDFILRLKKERKYVTTLKNGLRLMGSLLQKDLSVLDELFPWVRTEIAASVSKQNPDDSDLKRQIADLRRLIVEQGSISAPPPDYPIMKPAALGGLKKMSLPLLDDDDDNQDTLVLKKASGNTTENFFASMAKIGL
jgi:hypothetical protein